MRGFSFFQESIGEECEAEEGRGRERKRESLCRFNILTDESPLAMLRMEIVGPDSAVTARRQIINFSLDAKRIPLSVCSPPPSSVCLPFFASVVSSIGLSLSRCLFDFAKWKNFSRMQEEKLTGGRGSRPCRPFYSNFFLSSLPLPPLEYFHSDARLDARLPYYPTIIPTIIPTLHTESQSFVRFAGKTRRI